MTSNVEQALLLLQQAKEKIDEVEGLLSGSEKQDDGWVKVLKDVESRGGVVDKSEWIEIGKKYGYDTRGLGGFYTGKRPTMVVIAGDRRAMTDRAKELLRDYHGKNG